MIKQITRVDLFRFYEIFFPLPPHLTLGSPMPGDFKGFEAFYGISPPL